MVPMTEKTSGCNGVHTNKHYNGGYGNSASCPGTFALGMVSCTLTENKNLNVLKGISLNHENANIPGDQIFLPLRICITYKQYVYICMCVIHRHFLKYCDRYIIFSLLFNSKK